jgi:hypothetical protein
MPYLSTKLAGWSNFFRKKKLTIIGLEDGFSDYKRTTRTGPVPAQKGEMAGKEHERTQNGTEDV